MEYNALALYFGVHSRFEFLSSVKTKTRMNSGCLNRPFFSVAIMLILSVMNKKYQFKQSLENYFR